MEGIIISVFVIGYLLIALEHKVKIDKTATALVTGVLCWTIFMASPETFQSLTESHTLSDSVPQIESYRFTVLGFLAEHLSEISQILFFLMGAMTIVELVDQRQGFRVITDNITTKSPRTLLWIVCIITFFLSSVLDNLTTTIVMVSLVRKILPVRDLRLIYAGMIVIAANAGGAWSPIGDVTTTMLWIGGQISAIGIMKDTFLPSVVCILIPVLMLSHSLKGRKLIRDRKTKDSNQPINKDSKIMFVLGIAGLLFVPIFKTVTHLPPYTGMIFSLGIIWMVSEFLSSKMEPETRRRYSVSYAISKIDMSSILFFLGILLAVGALQSMGTLLHFAQFLDNRIGDQRIIVTLIGMLSAVVDNVPLVAASKAMYSLQTYPMDSMLWAFLAYCAGTGGSMLIIGSAAGVAAMGMEKINFVWYLKKISLMAALGYFAGAAVYLLQFHLVN